MVYKQLETEPKKEVKEKTDIQKLLIQEIKLENLRYESLKNLNNRLSEIIDSLVIRILKIDKGENPEKIKRWIRDELNVLYDEFYVSSRKEIEEQSILYPEVKEKTSLIPLIIAGFLFSELINNQKEVNIRKFFEKVNNIDANFDDFLAKNQTQIHTILKTSSRAYRSEVRSKADNIIGWQSLAVLDSKTSAICVSLHQKFYSIDKYKNFEDIPNRPPRHLGCRSLLIPIYKKQDMVDDFSLNDFLKEFGKEILGERKYNLFLSGSIPAKDFLDIKNGKWYTMKEIMEDL